MLNLDSTKSVVKQSSFGPSYLGGADNTGATNTGTGTTDDFNSVAISGRYKYVTQTGDTTACSQTVSAIGCELKVFDVSVPGSPTYIGGADGAGTTNGGTNGTANNFVTVSGRYAYVGKVGNGTACNASAGNANGCEIQIYDVANPGAPTFAGAIDASGSATGSGNETIHSMYVLGRYLYVAKANDPTACSQAAGSAIGCELMVFDVSNPASPAYLGGADITGSANSGTGDETAQTVFVSGRYIYLGKAGHSATACSQTVSAIGCELQIYDGINPASPSYIGGADASGSTNTGSTSVNFLSIFVQGRYAYVAKNSSGGPCASTPNASGCELQIYNVAIPSAPAYVGGADASGSTNSGTGGSTANAVIVSGNYVYLAKNGNSDAACSQTAGSALSCELQMYDASNPAAPTYVGGADADGSTNTGTTNFDFYDLAISGRYVYIAQENDGTGPTCSQSAGSATGCEGKVFDISGIEAVSVLAHSLDAGSLQVQNNASIAGQLSVTGALSVGQNANIQGDLSVGGKVTVTTSSATTAGSTIMSVNNSSSVSLLEVKQMGTNFGAYAETGAFIDRNAYIAEEFSRARTAVAGDTASVAGGGTFGDTESWQVDEQTASTNDCQAIIAADTVNGIAQLQNDDASTTCNMYYASALADLHLQFDADNLPVTLMKVRPSHVGANDDLWVGLQDQTQLTTNDEPDQGMFFTNADASTWTGVVKTSDANRTAVTCTGQTVNTGAAQYALLKVEVVSTSDVRFYVDNDVSNGISWFYCGSATTGANIPTAGLSSMLKWSSTTTTRQLNTDFFRVWQDDSQPQSEEPAEENQTETPESSQPPLEVITPTNEAENAFIDFTAATSQDMVYENDVYIYGTLFVNKVKANQIEGLELFTDKLASLQQQLSEVETSENGGGQTSVEPGQVAGFTSNGLDISALNLSLSNGLSVGGEAQFYGSSFFHRLVTFVEKVVFKNDVSLEGHLLTAGSKPSIKLENAAGMASAGEADSGEPLASVNIEGNDNTGQIELNIGDGSSTGELLTLDFNKPYAKAPSIFISPLSPSAAHLKYYIKSKPEGFTLVVLEPQSPGATIKFNYWTVQ